jgi:hypothetical protein
MLSAIGQHATFASLFSNTAWTISFLFTAYDSARRSFGSSNGGRFASNPR